jgi:hypothetical protein
MKIMYTKVKFSILIICLICASGCINISDETVSKLSDTEIRIGDTPLEAFTHVNLTFSEVKFYSDTLGWKTIPLVTTTIDLMDLHRNNRTKILATKNLEIGTYSQLRIALSNATGVTNEGKKVIFNITSNTLQIQHRFTFNEGNNTVSIDIDLNNSIHTYEFETEALYRLQPVIGELNMSFANGTMIRFRENERIINYGNGTQIILQDENTLQNMIGNRQPIIDVVVNGKRGTTFQFRINQNITLNASGTFDVDNDPLNYSWSFGDNTSGNGKIITHTYSQEGTYQIRLRVSDTELEDTRIITISIIKTGSPGDNN